MASKLEQMQATFQKRQMQEREEKLIKLYENQQQRAIERVSRGSAGSSGGSSHAVTITTGKVRQMFDERRQKAGIDKSYPLEPLRNSSKNRTISLDRKTTVPPKTTKIANKPVPLRNINAKKDNKVVAMGSLYNNNNNNNSFGDEVDGINDQNGLVHLMNDHNLNGNLEDEEMPSTKFDDYDIFKEKLTNIGGKLPSQKMVQVKAEAKKVKSPLVNNATSTKKPAAKGGASASNKNTNPPKRDLGSSRGSSKESTPMASPTKMMKSPSKPTPSAMVVTSETRAPSALRNTVKPAYRPLSSNMQRDDLAACRYCQRRFASDRIQTHENICGRTAKKKRRVFDASKHRLEGTELEPFSSKPTKGSKTKAGPAPAQGNKSNWRQKHEEFIAAIRAAKMAQEHVAKGGDIRDLPPPPPSSNPDYVQCPHCGRRFNQQAAARHIPQCANFQFNRPKPSASTRIKK